MGSTWGNHLKISVFGESHGKGVGVIIDGFPAGVNFDMEFVFKELAKRAPGNSGLTTSRKEMDIPIISTGMIEGVTTGAPICMVIQNKDGHSSDYETLRNIPRPSHSDYTGRLRYRGNNDIRGGGHFSARLTAPLVFTGAICKDFLRKNYGIEIGAHICQVGEIKDDLFDMSSIDKETLLDLQYKVLPVLNQEAEEKIKKTVEEARKNQDSVGGAVECAATGIFAGIGSPIFENIESRIASILYSIPGVKGVEFGLGFDYASKKGSEVNDCYAKDQDTIVTKTNNNGGISGGITTGMPVIVRVALKPTPSISKEQQTLNITTGEEEILKISGRHDPCVALRAPVIVEALVAIAIMDLYLEAYGYDAR